MIEKETGTYTCYETEMQENMFYILELGQVLTYTCYETETGKYVLYPGAGTSFNIYLNNWDTL